MADLLSDAVLERVTGETFTEAFEFSGIIPEGETVSSKTVTATAADGTDATSSVVSSSSISSTTVNVVLVTGSSAASYLIKVAATSSGGTPKVMTKLLNVFAPGIYV